MSRRSSGQFAPLPDRLLGRLETRREHRYVLDIADATLREAGCQAATVEVHDLSVSGFRTEWHYRLQVGQRVWLKLPDVESLPAFVRWSKEFEIGCEFEVPLHPAVLYRITSAVLGHRRWSTEED